MPFLPALLATVLYCVPLVVVVMAARLSPAWSTRELAVAVPAAVALDLLGVLALAHAMRVETAVLVSRAVWGAALVALLAWRLAHRRARAAAGERPFDLVTTVTLACAAVAATLASEFLSRRFAIWDRQWHIPLVTSLRGQRLPFVNVYQPRVNLGYHVSGNVLAAALQTLSHDRLHSSAALSLAHDLMFALCGLTIAALLWKPGRPWRAALLAGFLPLAVLFAGPITPLGPYQGYSYLNYYQMSFRPHVVLAGLLIAGASAAVLLDATADGARRGLRLWALLPTLALMAITDEPAAVMLIPALALVALARREPGAPVLPSLGVAALFPVTVGVALLLFPSALVSGPRASVAFLAPHVPSLTAPTLPLANPWGAMMFLQDVGPMLASLGLTAILVWRGGRREVRAAVLFGAVSLVLACGLLTTVVVGNSAAESHRFMTLPMVALPILALAFVPRASPRMKWALAAALCVPVVCSANWAVMSQRWLPYFAPDHYAWGVGRGDCGPTRADVGEAARPTYVPGPAFYFWTGCHPVLAPGNSAGLGTTGVFPDVGRPIDGPLALAVLSSRFPLGANEDLIVACPASAAADDLVCRAASHLGVCSPAGGEWTRCLLSPAARRAAAREAPIRPRPR